ncbi:hypothetical protein [Niveispirillum irakense]|uniref:hypothetical protein n=1 Tax=Niveispirillum irakense TaxID=34011 RepID=UPI0012B5A888|nr:hypothetical protein [Niveispirillum irakense]
MAGTPKPPPTKFGAKLAQPKGMRPAPPPIPIPPTAFPGPVAAIQRKPVGAPPTVTGRYMQAKPPAQPAPIQAKPAGLAPAANAPIPPTRFGPSPMQAKRNGPPPPPPTTRPAIVQPATIAGQPIKKTQKDKAFNKARVSKAARGLIDIAINSSIRNFSNYAEFERWIYISYGWHRRKDAAKRAEARRSKNGYKPKAGKISNKHRMVNLGLSKSKEIEDNIAAGVTKKVKKRTKMVRVKMPSENINSMFGPVNLYDQGNYDATPFTTAKLADYGHTKTDKRAPHAPKTKKSPNSYPQLIHDIKNSGKTERQFAQDMLDYLNAKDSSPVAAFATSYVRKAASIFLAAVQASEEGRNNGAAKFARALLAAIAAGTTTFAKCFGDTNNATFTPARSDGSSAFAMETEDDNPDGNYYAALYMSDSSDED